MLVFSQSSIEGHLFVSDLAKINKASMNKLWQGLCVKVFKSVLLPYID